MTRGIKILDQCIGPRKEKIKMDSLAHLINAYQKG